jgi:short-subunit dehydrogenase
LPRTIVIFGAGPALGLSVAKRFGRDGYSVVLVARDAQRLNSHVDELEAAGVEAVAFPADLADVGAIPRLLSAIRKPSNTIHTIVYSPIDPKEMGHGLLDLSPENLDPLLDLFVRTPIAIVREVLPEMRNRHHGSLMFCLGTSAISPLPAVAGVGLAMSALRNYAHNLHTLLAADGVFAGDIVITGGIDRSAFASIARTRESAGSRTFLNPDDLADTLWNMCVSRDRVEVVIGKGGAPSR